MTIGRTIIYFRKTGCQGEFGIGIAECGLRNYFKFGSWKAKIGKIELRIIIYVCFLFLADGRFQIINEQFFRRIGNASR